MAAWTRVARTFVRKYSSAAGGEHAHAGKYIKLLTNQSFIRALGWKHSDLYLGEIRYERYCHC